MTTGLCNEGVREKEHDEMIMTSPGCDDLMKGKRTAKFCD